MVSNRAPPPELPQIDSAACRSILCSLAENARTGVIVAGADGIVIYANPELATIVDVNRAALVGASVDTLLAGSDRAGAEWQGFRSGETAAYAGEHQLRRADGSSVRVRVTANAVSGAEFFVVQLEDIDRQKKVEAAFAASEQRWNYALEAAGQGVWDSDLRTRRMFYSAVWKTIRGYAPDAEIDDALDSWRERIHPDDRDRVLAEIGRHNRGEIPSFAMEYRERRVDGAWIWILSRGKAVAWQEDGTPARIVGTDTDITELKHEEDRKAAEAEEAFRHSLARLEKANETAEQAQQLALSLARHDALTGLPNRRVFAEALARAIARSERGGGRCAVAIIDLDRFKPVNDILGHAAGDTVLCEIAHRLKHVARQGDTVARFGGDEFAVIIETRGATEDPADAAVRFVRRVFDAIGRGVNVGSRSVEIGASIGISICPTDGREPEALLRAADIAMYRAKEEGRGRYRLFRAAMEVELRARAALEEDVRDAVQQGVIVPHYQPLIRLADSHLTGFEVLARWHHPRRGDVPPGVFIPVVEQIGLIADLTYALLRRACREALDWPSDIIIALNVSPLHLADPLLPVRILAILSEVGFPPTRLEIEITESGIAKDVDKARSALTTLKELGIKISLDDFGTGYSSLYRLRELHFDKIKIDRSFVHAMLNDPADAQLVRSILDMARNLGVPAIAEGVEQLDTIRAIMAGGGEFGQGYYFGKAMTAAAATRMITEGTGGGATIATG